MADLATQCRVSWLVSEGMGENCRDQANDWRILVSGHSWIDRRAGAVVENSLSAIVSDGVMLVDPKHFMTRGYEKAGVELLVRMFKLAIESGTFSDLEQKSA